MNIILLLHIIGVGEVWIIFELFFSLVARCVFFLFFSSKLF